MHKNDKRCSGCSCSVDSVSNGIHDTWKAWVLPQSMDRPAETVRRFSLAVILVVSEKDLWLTLCQVSSFSYSSRG